jgi:hypothetical protein
LTVGKSFSQAPQSFVEADLRINSTQHPDGTHSATTVTMEVGQSTLPTLQIPIVEQPELVQQKGEEAAKGFDSEHARVVATVIAAFALTRQDDRSRNQVGDWRAWRDGRLGTRSDELVQFRSRCQ